MKGLILSLVISTAYGLQYNGLRVTFGWSSSLADIEYFFKIPRTISEVENEEWKRCPRPSGPMPELRMYCPPGNGVCPMYDPAGFVAGLQINFPIEEYDPGVEKPEMKLMKWRSPAVPGDPAREYWYSEQFFVSEESLKAGAGPQVENGATLQDGGVWVFGPDARLMRIPTTEAELNTTMFKKQICIPNMGTHYYYNMTREAKCEKLSPWFALVTDGELVGTGLQIFGKLNKQTKTRDWFERPPVSKKSIRATVPSSPDCVGEWAEKYGIFTLHIYYIDDPWNIRCGPGDSVKALPIMQRLLLNGYRYLNKVNDEVKRLIIG